MGGRLSRASVRNEIYDGRRRRFICSIHKDHLSRRVVLSRSRRGVLEVCSVELAGPDRGLSQPGPRGAPGVAILRSLL